MCSASGVTACSPWSRVHRMRSRVSSARSLNVSAASATCVSVGTSAICVVTQLVCQHFPAGQIQFRADCAELCNRGSTTAAGVPTVLAEAGRVEWVLLAYLLPREPSTPRITLWRKLRRLGVVQLLDGLVALPADARTREQMEWLADEVVDAHGEASLWVGRLASAAQERELAARMAEAVAEDYRQVIHEAGAAATEPEA